MSVKKHLQLCAICIKLETMDRTSDVFTFSIITIATLLRIAITVIFFQAIYGQVQMIGGLDISHMYVLLGTYFLIDGISWATYTRGFIRIMRLVDKGNFDLLLVTPVNLKAYLSYRFIDVIFSTPAIIAAILLIIYGAQTSAEPIYLITYIPFVLIGFVLHFSFTLMLGTINFFYIIETPQYLRNSIMKLGEYPITIFKGLAKMVFTFVIPLAFMFTVPARAFFGDVGYMDVITGVSLALIFYLLSSVFWNAGLRHYKSAQG